MILSPLRFLPCTPSPPHHDCHRHHPIVISRSSSSHFHIRRLRPCNAALIVPPPASLSHSHFIYLTPIYQFQYPKGILGTLVSRSFVFEQSRPYSLPRCIFVDYDRASGHFRTATCRQRHHRWHSLDFHSVAGFASRGVPMRGSFRLLVHTAEENRRHASGSL